MTDNTEHPLRQPDTIPRRILVVDDNVDIMDSLAMVLRMMGHEVACAGDGAVAVTLLAEWQADLAFIDLGMRGMNGLEVAQHVRRHPWGSNIVLIAMTGWGRDEDRIRSLAAGFDQHAVKPVNLETLRALIDGVTPSSEPRR